MSSVAASSNINYATQAGIVEPAPAIVFACLYALLVFLFVAKSISCPTYVHFVMTFFCTIRVTAFIIRSVLATSTSAGQNIHLVLAEGTLFGVGFFGLLYSAYILVLNLEQMQSGGKPTSRILRFTQNRRAFRLTLLVAVILGIAAPSDYTNSGTSSRLRQASTIIFLVLTAFLVLQAIYLARIRGLGSTDERGRDHNTFGAKYAVFIMLAISLLILIREAFYTATLWPKTQAAQFNENFWYPLVALPEILAVMLYTIPGLVPSNMEMSRRQQELQEYNK